MAMHHQVVIVGGGSAGIWVASRLLKGIDDVAVIEPSEKHYYQPLWTLVGGGQSTVQTSVRSEKSVMPKKATWIKDAANGFDPENNAVHTASGATITYDALVVCAGIQLDWDKIPGVKESLGKYGVSSNYLPELAPKTWEFVQATTAGTAVFTMPSGPIKCAGAPQKIAYLACDYWRRQGVLDKIDVHFKSELESLDPVAKTATFKSMDADGAGFSLSYDMLHVVPHQSAPDWVKSSSLAQDAPAGYVDVDKHTHQPVRYPNVFSLGDVGSTPNSKTGAAVRQQPPVVAANVQQYLTVQ